MLAWPMSERRSIVLCAFDDCQALDVIGPCDVFDAAGRVVGGDPARNQAYRIRLATPGRARFRTTSGPRIEADLALERVRGPIDTLIVAGGAGTRRAAGDPAIVRAIGRAAARAERVASVCTGAFLLAAAGLLDGRRATTHWAHCPRLAREYPAVEVEPDAIFVRDCALWTSAGVTAGMDLALALVEADHGREVALTVARHLVMFVRRPGGQSQFSAQLASQVAERDALRDLQVWILDHVAEDLRVPALAARAGMSARNFARVFRGEVGVTPAVFVERARIEVARRLLETTGLEQQAVADATGFSSADVMRRAFARQVGVSPAEYRARFAAHHKDHRSWTSSS